MQRARRAKILMRVFISTVAYRYIFGSFCSGDDDDAGSGVRAGFYTREISTYVTDTY